VSKLAAIRRRQVTWSQDFRGRGRPWGIFFGVYKTRHILLSDKGNCTVLCAVVLTQYQRVTDIRTDRQTDRIAVASTALAMRALRRVVIITITIINDNVYGAVLMTMVIARVHPVHLMNAD